MFHLDNVVLVAWEEEELKEEDKGKAIDKKKRIESPPLPPFIYFVCLNLARAQSQSGMNLAEYAVKNINNIGLSG